MTASVPHPGHNWLAWAVFAVLAAAAITGLVLLAIRTGSGLTPDQQQICDLFRQNGAIPPSYCPR